MSRAISNRFIDTETNTVKFFTRSPHMVQALTYLNKLYAQGLLDPEAFTYNSETRSEAYAQGKPAFIWDALLGYVDHQRHPAAG